MGACHAPSICSAQETTFGSSVATGCQTLVTCGPVVGKVSPTTANILLEIDEDATITCTLTPLKGGHPVTCQLPLRPHFPAVFACEGLLPNTSYSARFAPLAPVQGEELEKMGCVVRTPPVGKDVRRLRLLALSCDYPSRVKEGEENPWGRVAKICKAGDCDVVMHLGDQVYTKENGCLEAAQRILKLAGKSSPELQLKMQLNAARKLQESYQSTWSQPDKAVALAHASNLMIWSDNDVANDFTVLRNGDSSQEYDASFLSTAMRVYRMYQRSLWDPACNSDQRALLEGHHVMEEWHFHVHGFCGLFFLDMRGHRIASDGRLFDGLPSLLSERQRQALREAFRSPGVSCMVLAAEIPFVGEPPGEIQQKAEKMPMLKDHWPYEVEVLTWLLDLCFDWKAAVAGREVFLVAGDIHVAVDSVIHDHRTGQSIRHITTSPITNESRAFWPVLEGKVNDRYSYKHTPLPKHRNFLQLDLEFDGQRVSSKYNMVLVEEGSAKGKAD